jgi:predicted nuclease of predicted toxin-antitoxin system
MRFLVDESAGPALARWLRETGHEAVSVFDDLRGATDATILDKAAEEDRILVTTDKDFGEMALRQRRAHKGIILLRLRDQRSVALIEAMTRLLAAHSAKLADRFVVVTEDRVRIAGR